MGRIAVSGGYQLKGSVAVSGSKNSTLPILASLILIQGKSVIHNIPNLSDIKTMLKMLNFLNIRSELRSANVIYARNRGKIKHLVPYELVTRMRASFFVAGPILAKTGWVKIPLPGGCAIGARPVDLHLRGFESLGAQIRIEHGFVEIKTKKLKGSEIVFPFQSVGATENIMMAAVLAEGVTEIKNAACEPEIVDLANFLNSAGGKISGAGTEHIVIQGVSSLSGSEHTVIPDRIEAGTLAVAAAVTGGDVIIENIVPEHLKALIVNLREMGVPVEIGQGFIHVRKAKEINSINIETSPFPGFPTDMQAQIMVLCAIAKGTSVIKENVFENRFMHAQELTRMGAQITVKDRLAIVNGVKSLSAAPVRTSDLRAGAALWLAALSAKGETLIYDDGHLSRGYDHLDKKLKQLGAKIKKD